MRGAQYWPMNNLLLTSRLGRPTEMTSCAFRSILNRIERDFIQLVVNRTKAQDLSSLLDNEFTGPMQSIEIISLGIKKQN